MNAEHQPIDAHAGPSSIPTRLKSFFQAMGKLDASDLHLKAGKPPLVRINTAIRPTKSDALSAEEIESMAYELMDEAQQQFFTQHGSIDLALAVEGGDRFRLNVFRQRGKVSMAIRRVTADVPDFEALHLPAAVGQIAEAQRGLVLLSGATGSGKSTTIASMLEHINRTRPCHIITVEDPIEYLFEDRKAIVSQREIGIDVEDYASALKYLMREDPDVVLIGEMRDPETFRAALQASETGHLVFGTVHASSAAQTVSRVLNLLAAEERDHVRQSLAFNLRGIICQKLLPSVREDIDRVPAVEILQNNTSVRQLLAEGRDAELPEVVRSNEGQGMVSFTQCLFELVEKDFIAPKVAYEAAPNVSELQMMLKGINARQSNLLG